MTAYDHYLEAPGRVCANCLSSYSAQDGCLRCQEAIEAYHEHAEAALQRAYGLLAQGQGKAAYALLRDLLDEWPVEQEA